MSSLIPLDLSPFFDTHPTLETDRLLLRQIALSDAEDMYAYHSDPEIARYVSFDPAESVEKTREVISRMILDFEKRDSFFFAIVLRSTGRLIGTLDLYNISKQHRKLTIGYILTRAHWGNGYMIEAMKTMIRFLFDEVGIHRIEAECEVENAASQRLAERCGFTCEGTLRDNERSKGRFVSNKVYAIVNSKK